MEARPLTLSQANEAVERLHRHHNKVRGHRFSIGAYVGSVLVGAAIVGRPVSRGVPPYDVAEVTRLVTDGTRNACSFLYSRCARAAKAMGFLWIQTYILDIEPGTSLLASGWERDGTVRGVGWDVPGWDNRSGRRGEGMGPKVRWKKDLNGPR